MNLWLSNKLKIKESFHRDDLEQYIFRVEIVLT